MLPDREGEAHLARNLELKVRCDDEEHRRILEAIPVDDVSERRELHQRDTYFVVPRGRLKLRQIDDGKCRAAELIQYQRPDTSGMRMSSYRRTEIAANQAPVLLASLEDALGTLTVVDKTRTVILWRATRIHLDQVAQLGHFVELETVLGDGKGAEDDGKAEFDAVVQMLDLAGLESVAGSYSDLMIGRQHAR